MMVGPRVARSVSLAEFGGESIVTFDTDGPRGSGSKSARSVASGEATSPLTRILAEDPLYSLASKNIYGRTSASVTSYFIYSTVNMVKRSMGCEYRPVRSMNTHTAVEDSRHLPPKGIISRFFFSIVLIGSRSRPVTFTHFVCSPNDEGSTPSHEPRGDPTRGSDILPSHPTVRSPWHNQRLWIMDWSRYIVDYAKCNRRYPPLALLRMPWGFEAIHSGVLGNHLTHAPYSGIKKSPGEV